MFSIGVLISAHLEMCLLLLALLSLQHREMDLKNKMLMKNSHKKCAIVMTIPVLGTYEVGHHNGINHDRILLCAQSEL